MISRFERVNHIFMQYQGVKKVEKLLIHLICKIFSATQIARYEIHITNFNTGAGKSINLKRFDAKGAKISYTFFNQ